MGKVGVELPTPWAPVAPAPEIFWLTTSTARLPARTGASPAARRRWRDDFEMGDGARLDGGDQAQEGEGRQGGDEEQGDTGDHGGEPPITVATGGTDAETTGQRADGEGEDGGDDQLREHEGDQGVGQPPAPVGDGRPHQRGEGQGEEEDGHRDGGGAHDELEPQSEGGEGDEKSAHEHHEGGNGGNGQTGLEEEGRTRG